VTQPLSNSPSRRHDVLTSSRQSSQCALFVTVEPLGTSEGVSVFGLSGASSDPGSLRNSCLFTITNKVLNPNPQRTVSERSIRWFLFCTKVYAGIRRSGQTELRKIVTFCSECALRCCFAPTKQQQTNSSTMAPQPKKPKSSVDLTPDGRCHHESRSGGTQ